MSVSCCFWNTRFITVITLPHNIDVMMGAMASQITSLTIVCSTVYPGADQRKYKSSTSLAFVQGIHWWPTNSPHKWSVTRKLFPFDDVIMHICVFVKCSMPIIYFDCFVRKDPHNTLSPRKNYWHFPDDIFKCIFFNENIWTSIKISLKFVPKSPIKNIFA